MVTRQVQLLRVSFARVSIARVSICTFVPEKQVNRVANGAPSPAAAASAARATGARAGHTLRQYWYFFTSKAPVKQVNFVPLPAAAPGAHD